MVGGEWGRKDGFPGADGSNLSATMPIYGPDGNTLIEGSTGVGMVNIFESGVLNENTSQIYMIKHPLTVIYNSTSSKDWYTNSSTYQNNTLWGDEDIKRAYDPCPYGWRVPTDASRTFGDFSITTFLYYIQGNQTSLGNSNVTNGRLYNQISWFPAAGYRNNHGGVLGNVGYNGCYWTASISSSYAKYLSFNMSTSNSTAYSRASSFPVRCVQE